MSFFRTITSNPLLNLAFVSWAAAQLIKVILTLITTKEFVPERLFGPGGMPSSHSALVCSLAVGVVRSEGFQSPLFAICFVYAAVVMYDAMGVRREAGRHAELLNRMRFDFNDLNRDLTQLFSTIKLNLLKDEDKQEQQMNEEILEEIAQEGEETDPDRKLKEILGHTPLEVLGGALLGILLGMVWPV